MGNVDRFMEGIVAELRGRLTLLADSGERRSLEDGIALLTDYRLSGIDEARFEKVLATLAAGRSPVASVLKPQSVGRELERRWHAFRSESLVVAGR